MRSSAAAPIWMFESRPDAEAAVVREKLRAVEDAVAERGFGQRAQAGHRTRRRKPARLVFGHVRRVDQAPARIDVRIVEQPRDRRRLQRRDAVRDFLGLLRRMNVDRPAAMRRDGVAQRLRRHGAQRMRRDADARIGQRLHDLARARDQRRVAVRIVEEALLALVRRRAAEPAMDIKSGQQRQPDAGRVRRRRDARRHLAEVGVRPPVDVVMQVVEFADRREAGLEHLHVGERRDRLDVVGRQLAEEAVHHLAPGPEAVMRRASLLGESRHAALERVAVQVRHAGDREARDVLRAVARRIRRDARDRAVGHVDAHVARPAGIQQRMIEMIRGHGASHARLCLSAQGGAVMRQHERHAQVSGPATRTAVP